MAPTFDVCIRGGGTVGRTLALLLAREQLRVGLVEAAPAVTGHGDASDLRDVRAYALNAASRDLLEGLRAWPATPHTTPVRGMEVQGDDGGALRFGAPGQEGEPVAWIVDGAALQERLSQAIGYQPLVTRLQAPQEATLTVVCEGRHSATRAEYGVTFDVTDYPQKAIAARLHCEKNHGQLARQWFANGEILAFLPMSGENEAEQGNLVALVWSVESGRAPDLLALEPGEFEAQVQAASQGALGSLRLASERAAWPLQMAHADRWCGPGWALAGDAAHTVHPLAGQGLNLGLADARALAKVMREREYWRGVGDWKLLRRYERARKADVLAMGLATDGLQQLFARPEAPLGWLRNWGMTAFDRTGPLKDWVARQASGRF